MELSELLQHINSLGESDRVNLLEHLKSPNIDVTNNDLTVVTGLWNIGRPGRDFSHYIENFKKFLEIPVNMFIYIPKEYEYLVWEKRSSKNTYVKVYELETELKNLYAPFWEETQKVRTNPDWYNQTGEDGWLKSSPQAALEWYNPIVQSKMFLLNDVTIWNPFNTEYFIWLDAGIGNTVDINYFTRDKALDKLLPYLESFLFLSFPYEANDEIHGFKYSEMNRYSREKVEYVCRGGLFGGKKEYINQANSEYYILLQRSLAQGLMGTEESIFTIMSYLYPDRYRRYALDSNGFIVKFAQALIDDKVELEAIPKTAIRHSPLVIDISKLKMSVYMLTFNFTHQLEHTIQKWLKHDKWLQTTRNILIDNSTNEESRESNKLLCEKYNFEHIITGKNGGICGGRQLAAEHFNESDSDYYLFLEDDMGIHPPDTTEFCRNGFRKFVPNLHDTVLKIMEKEQFDYLKLSYTEVYMDNNIQVSWYNVPQEIRSEFWPLYDRLPETGLDPDSPKTEFNNINVIDGVSYISGDIYYANWPTVMGKQGNKRVFLDVKWAHPYEQTWMSYVFQECKKGNIKPAVLLASPVDHDRIAHYTPEERREN